METVTHLRAFIMGTMFDDIGVRSELQGLYIGPLERVSLLCSQTKDRCQVDGTAFHS